MSKLCVLCIGVLAGLAAATAGFELSRIAQAQSREGAPVIRRVVTGHDANKVAKVIKDGPAANVKYGASGNASTLIWSMDTSPADISIGTDVEDRGARILGTAPPPNGSRFAVIEYAPGNKGVMHRTETIDYIVVIAGEIEMQMDDSTVKLKAGDVMVQRGTHHAWNNRGTVPARLAFVLIDAKPLGIGHAVTGTANPR